MKKSVSKKTIVTLENIWEQVNVRASKSNCGFGCDRGWEPILVRLINFLDQIQGSYRIYQIKEKFGGLRFYTTATRYTKAGYKLFGHLVAEAGRESYETCERCGDEGKERTDKPWIQTLCDRCTKIRNTADDELSACWKKIHKAHEKDNPGWLLSDKERKLLRAIEVRADKQIVDRLKKTEEKRRKYCDLG